MLIREGRKAMTKRYRLGLAAIAAALLVGWMLPASAAELQVPSLHRAVTVAVPKKPVRRPLIKIASIEPLPSSGSELRYVAMLVLGIGF